MICTHKNAKIEDILTEAAQRIGAALWMMEQARENHAPDNGGYDFEIARDALEDVADVLRKASEHPINARFAEAEAEEA